MKAGAVVADIFLECGGGRRERETVAMGHEGRGGGGGQDQGTSSLVKNRTAEGPTLSKTKDERVEHPRIVSRVDLCSTRLFQLLTACRPIPLRRWLGSDPTIAEMPPPPFQTPSSK